MGQVTKWAALGLGAWLLLSACGGSSEGSSDCSNAAACGGNLVGSWKITSSCLTVEASSMPANMNCPSATSQASGWKVSGTFTFNADLTYTSMTTISGNVIVTLPASCLTSGAVTLTCSQLQQQLESQLDSSSFSSASCAGSSGCSCSLALVPMESTASGTYATTPAGALTQAQNGAASDGSDYCVKGNTLTVSPRADSTMMGTTSVTGSITLTKQ